MDATRIISLQALRQELEHENNRTIRIDPKTFARVDFEPLFHRHYAEIKAFNKKDKQGLCLYICSGEELIGKAFVSSKDGSINSLLLGRHSESEIFLTKDQSLSLRHLVFLTYPASEQLTYRIIDLRSRSGFENESGELCQALIANGHAFIRLNHYHLICLPSNFPPLENNTSAEAWADLPERQIGQTHDAGLIPQMNGLESSIVSIPAPQPLTNASPKVAIGTLELFSGNSYVIQPLDSPALRKGVLIGRYARCDTAFQPFLNSGAISRVHCLIIEVRGKIYLIDTASTNGTFVDGERIRRHVLGADTTFFIGDREAVHTDGLRLVWKNI